MGGVGFPLSLFLPLSLSLPLSPPPALSLLPPSSLSLFRYVECMYICTYLVGRDLPAKNVVVCAHCCCCCCCLCLCVCLSRQSDVHHYFALPCAVFVGGSGDMPARLPACLPACLPTYLSYRCHSILLRIYILCLWLWLYLCPTIRCCGGCWLRSQSQSQLWLWLCYMLCAVVRAYVWLAGLCDNLVV